MNTTKVKCLSQQISDAAQAIIALECIGDESVCEALLKMHRDNLKMYAEAMANELKVEA
ncbi:MAG: hypothetical protein ACRCXB_34325 [Aeromonadaceae bacterium]